MLRNIRTIIWDCRMRLICKVSPVKVSSVSSSKFMEERGRDEKHAEYERLAAENALKSSLLRQL